MNDCIFCKIVEGAIPSTKVYESDTVLAFRDIMPAAPVHILVIPKRHISTMNDVRPEDGALMGELLQAAALIAKEEGIAESGYRLINNCNADAGQTAYHLHFHVLGGRKLGALVEGHSS